MDGLLAKRCRDNFELRDRLRGDEYFRGSRVNLTGIGAQGISAVARGTCEYEIFLSFKRLDRNSLDVHCDCPRFEDGVLCKHVWAAIRVVDARGTLNLSGRKDLQIEALDPDEFEVGEPVPSLQSTAKLNLPPTQDASKSSRITSGASKVISKIEPPAKIVPAWQMKLESANRVAGSKTSSPSVSFDRMAVQESRNWFAITLADQAKASRFHIQLYESKTKKDGDWSVPMKVSVGRAELSSVRDPIARRILARLDWNIDQGNGYRHYGFEAQSTFGIITELCRETL